MRAATPSHGAGGPTRVDVAGAVVTLLPVLAVFLALQRYGLRGLLSGSMSG
jgi:multiple sugar transport system permease protein